MKENNIDIVILWVDSNDPAWLLEYNKYSKNPKDIQGADISSERFKDYGLLKYWFRSIEKNAGWVRKIHFVTCGQKPEWLNVNNPKLNLVDHKDYIPSEYLPVFSSHCIELMLHKIQGLSDKFVYFNDDFYLLKPVSSSYYFKNSLPCDYAGFTTLGAGASMIPHIVLNNIIEVNKNFNKKSILHRNFYKWFSFKNGSNVIKTIFSLPFNRIEGITVRHHAQPYLKKTFEEVWDKCESTLTNTMKHRFRNKYEDVNQWLFRNWQLCSGTFVPTNLEKKERLFKVSRITDKDLDNIKKGKYVEICINDDMGDSKPQEYEKYMSKVKNTFDLLFPEKSSFEL